ncbi:MAG: undecaprenyl-phosphate glucose phosphotransferase [Gammaproteobacteria bacterium]|nr:undecaprenyl-phosphate glucose phosphotransferase [Gammaproteobacteria bacterium]
MNTSGFVRSHQEHFSTIYRLCDLLIVFGTLLLTCQMLKINVDQTVAMTGIATTSLFLVVAESFELYRSWRTSSLRALLTTTTVSWIVVVAILLVAMFFFGPLSGLAPSLLLLWAGAAWVALCTWRYWIREFLYQIRREGLNTRTAAIIGVTPSGLELARSIEGNPQQGISLIGFFDDRTPERIGNGARYDLLGNVDDAISMAQQNKVDLLYVAMPLRAEERINAILERCADTTVNVHIIPNFFIYRVLHARWHEVGDVQTLSIYDTPLNGLGQWLKRSEDLVLASVILAVISLPMLVIALGIKLTSPGPVFFKQDRYGLDGKKIKVWKFRSMRTMENGAKVTQATKGDPRITKFGAFLRRTSLDELPQFFNVIQGSMSIVGPRPHAVAHNEQYRQLISGYMLRHKVKPGITGWAQINGWRGETDTLDKMEKRIEFDLAYIRNWSLWLDMKIVFWTIFRGFVGANAY